MQLSGTDGLRTQQKIDENKEKKGERCPNVSEEGRGLEDSHGSMTHSSVRLSSGVWRSFRSSWLISLGPWAATTARQARASTSILRQLPFSSSSTRLRAEPACARLYSGHRLSRGSGPEDSSQEISA